MENIENNNAVDYIPNRNEIERLVEPVVISMQQAELEQPFLDQSNPFNEQIRNCAYDVTISSNPNNPFVNIIRNENGVIDIESSENQQDAIGLGSRIQCDGKVLEEATSLESSLSEKSFADINSVEEALRALDFAISGEESLLQPNEDDFEDGTINEDVKFSEKCSMNDETSIGNAVNSYDNNYVAEVRKEAEMLVDSVLEESKSRICAGLMNQTYQNSILDCDKIEVRKDEEDEQHLIRDLQSAGSVENLCFDNIVLEASTPFITKSNSRKMPKSVVSPIIANATFDMTPSGSEFFDSPMVNDLKNVDNFLGISPLAAETHSQMEAPNANGTFVKNEKFEDTNHGTEFIANATFDIEVKKDAAPNETIVLDKTFPLTDKPHQINSTFTSSEEPLPKDSVPTIKIDKEDATSVDMTTVTPVNTPIELNYSLDSWDKFISNSMSQELVMPKHHVDDMQPCTSAQAAYAEANSSGWFLHSKADGKS